MRNILKALAITTATAFGCTSCSYLDMTPTDKVSDKVIWENTQNAEYAVNYLYSYLIDIHNDQCKAGMTEALTDQMKYSSYNYNALCYIPSEYAYGDATTITASYVDAYSGYWGERYETIRKVNQAMSEMEQFGKMPEKDKSRLNGELKFIRAFTYTDLAKRYGDAILYDEDMGKINKDMPLTDEGKIWNFIEQDLRDAAEQLPDRTTSKGRLDKGCAWALLSRAMLYAKKWDIAKEAADNVASLGYGLEERYEDSYGKTRSAGNNEAILQYLYNLSLDITHNFDFYYTPGGDYYANGQTGGGYGVPTQEMVESYELASGGYPDWKEWHNPEGTESTPPYEKMEHRFQATILYNGAKWKGRKIEPFIGGIDGWCQWNMEREPKGRTTTGYYLKKLVDENHDVIANNGSQQPATIIRYAEVLLNKAEACWQLGKEQEANDAIKAIRKRAGLPYANKTGNDLWESIRHERKIELAYEGFWYWDLRRWGIAHEAYPKGLSGYQLHGLKIEKKSGEEKFKYSYISVDDQDRNFPRRLYRYPIPVAELSSNGALDQFEEWK